MEKDALGNETISNRERLQGLNQEMARQLAPAMLFIALLMVIGLAGNLVVCFFFSFRSRMSTQHFLIVSLAVFDLVSCGIAMPTEIADMRYFLMFEDEFACRLLRFINFFSAFASILTLVVIAVDRYLKVCRPFGRQMSLRRTKMAVLMVVLVALASAAPAPVLYGIHVANITDLNRQLQAYDCSTSAEALGTVFPVVYGGAMFAAFFVTLAALTIMYCTILREMRRHNRYMKRNSSDSYYSNYSRRVRDSSVSIVSTATEVVHISTPTLDCRVLSMIRDVQDTEEEMDSEELQQSEEDKNQLEENYEKQSFGEADRELLQGQELIQSSRDPYQTGAEYDEQRRSKYFKNELQGKMPESNTQDYMPIVYQEPLTTTENVTQDHAFKQCARDNNRCIEIPDPTVRRFPTDTQVETVEQSIRHDGPVLEVQRPHRVQNAEGKVQCEEWERELQSQKLQRCSIEVSNPVIEDNSGHPTDVNSEELQIGALDQGYLSTLTCCVLPTTTNPHSGQRFCAENANENFAVVDDLNSVENVLFREGALRGRGEKGEHELCNLHTRERLCGHNFCDNVDKLNSLPNSDSLATRSSSTNDFNVEKSDSWTRNNALTLSIKSCDSETSTSVLSEERPISNSLADFGTMVTSPTDFQRARSHSLPISTFISSPNTEHADSQTNETPIISSLTMASYFEDDALSVQKPIKGDLPTSPVNEKTPVATLNDSLTERTVFHSSPSLIERSRDSSLTIQIVAKRSIRRNSQTSVISTVSKRGGVSPLTGRILTSGVSKRRSTKTSSTLGGTLTKTPDRVSIKIPERMLTQTLSTSKRALTKTASSSSTTSTRTASSGTVKTNKATAVAVAVTAVFFLSFLPYLSLLTARLVNGDFYMNLRGASLVFYSIFLRFYFINSVANPFIYGVLNSSFRKHCMALARTIYSCCKRHRRCSVSS